MYTRLVSSLLFPLHERVKQHSSVAVRKQLEESQYWPEERLREAITLSLAGVCVIVLLLGASLRSPARLAGVLLPLVLAVVLVIAGLQLAGEALHLLHLVGLLLVVAVGSNYGLFFDRAEGQADLEPSTVAAMGVANLTTTLGFGVLGFSTVPVLHAMGVTVGPGAVLVLLLAAMFKR